MKIEVGKTYLTRDGRKAVVIGKGSDEKYPLNVKVGALTRSYKSDGGYSYWGDKDLDLVTEWKCTKTNE
jgi:hypothetical protein